MRVLIVIVCLSGGGVVGVLFGSDTGYPRSRSRRGSGVGLVVVVVSGPVGSPSGIVDRRWSPGGELDQSQQQVHNARFQHYHIVFKQTQLPLHRSSG